MNTKIIAVSLVLGLAACHGNDRDTNSPQNDNTTTSSAPITNNDPSRSTTNTGAANQGTSSTQGDLPRQTPTDAMTPGSTPSSGSGQSGTAPVTTGGTSDTPANNNGMMSPSTRSNPTAMSQGQSAAELKITADIRKDAMKDGSLSFSAKNATIITQGTKVTLQGNVKTDAERAKLEGIARHAKNVTDVDNQLQVKP